MTRRILCLILLVLCVVYCKKKSTSKASPTKTQDSSAALSTCSASLALAQDKNPPPPNVPAEHANKLSIDSVTASLVDDAGTQNLLVTMTPTTASAMPEDLKDRVADFPRLSICDSTGKCLAEQKDGSIVTQANAKASIDFPQWSGVISLPADFSGNLQIKATACTYVRKPGPRGYLVPSGKTQCSSQWVISTPAVLKRDVQVATGNSAKLAQYYAIKGQIRALMLNLEDPAKKYLDAIGEAGPQSPREVALWSMAKGILRDTGLNSVMFSEKLWTLALDEAPDGSPSFAGLKSASTLGLADSADPCATSIPNSADVTTNSNGDIIPPTATVVQVQTLVSTVVNTVVNTVVDTVTQNSVRTVTTVNTVTHVETVTDTTPVGSFPVPFQFQTPNSQCFYANTNGLTEANMSSAPFEVAACSTRTRWQAYSLSPSATPKPGPGSLLVATATCQAWDKVDAVTAKSASTREVKRNFENCLCLSFNSTETTPEDRLNLKTCNTSDPMQRFVTNRKKEGSNLVAFSSVTAAYDAADNATDAADNATERAAATNACMYLDETTPKMGSCDNTQYFPLDYTIPPAPEQDPEVVTYSNTLYFYGIGKNPVERWSWLFTVGGPLLSAFSIYEGVQWYKQQQVVNKVRNATVDEKVSVIDTKPTPFYKRDALVEKTIADEKNKKDIKREQKSIRKTKAIKTGIAGVLGATFTVLGPLMYSGVIQLASDADSEFSDVITQTLKKYNDLQTQQTAILNSL